MPVDLIERPAPLARPAAPAATPEPTPSGSAETSGARRGILKRVIKYVALGLMAFLLVGNLGILAMSAWARSTASSNDSVVVDGVKNFQVVDERVWRSAAPTAEGYQSLVDAGVATVIDLRAEEGIAPPADWLRSQGVEFAGIAIRDGQTPTTGQVDRFLQIVAEADGPVLVHCGAGVGRTGAMVAAYLKAAGDASGSERLTHNLAVGPPSLEQIIYAAADDHNRPNLAVVAASRVLDSPRRIFHRLGF